MERSERIFNMPGGPADRPFIREEVERSEDRIVERVEQAAVARDRVRWGPIWAGLLTTLSLFLLFELMAYAFGWLSLGMGDFPGARRSDTWVAGIIGLISFFLGGLVTGATVLVRGPSAGLINGFCVWALGTVLILALTAIGLGSFFGASGNIFSQLIVWGRGINLGALGMSPDQLIASIRAGALWSFILMALSACAAMLGGLVGSGGRPIGRFRRADRVERLAGLHAE
ncbi:MAG TPA: hypothetical protein VHR27_17565 [Blastocatellia bacterium]|jgi:hypothetical protein|nr:hypothetical protein [Blastocatellia bacterium]